MILGVDLSHWQDRVDFPLLKAAGIEFAICKASRGARYTDSTFERHVLSAKQAGMVTGAYHWADPMEPPDEAQANHFLDVIEGYPVDFVMIDVEQYWQDWAEYRARQVTKFISPERIEQNALTVLNRVNSVFGPTVLYSRYSFMYDYAKGMLEWQNTWPMCWAQYPYKAGRVSVDWADFIANYLPGVDKLKLPPGVSDWHFWQFTGDKFLLPGVIDSTGKASALDVIYWNGDRDELVQFCGGEIVVDQPTEPVEKPAGIKMRVGVPVLNIRSGPSTLHQDIGDLHGNEIVEVLNVAGSDSWVEIAPGKWACVQRGNTQYLVKVEE